MDQNKLDAKPENEDTLPRGDNFKSIVKDAFNDFKVRERNFFLALSRSQCLKFGDNPDPMYATCHMRHHIEILLTLKEVKTCALIAHYTARDIVTEMVEQCLKPVMQAYKLSRYGFQLHQITHPMHTTAHSGFQNAWVFADTRLAL
ncbi:uncharacterized protein LY89DRAFT_684644 [Mollisia scopiformis]|uniref:Uncharacterized protein n=1 Tax=Mollisia scopiformis TaxID=149040 RepID=A0A194XBX3_MOLSC|nr:uncharacterized protein LY89DRAFT_684644 [Mollisia scopiformis]KUJ17664.1 hypothetical protein LY89DRAFT_684644 [Mollisia scopiformis]